MQITNKQILDFLTSNKIPYRFEGNFNFIYSKFSPIHQLKNNTFSFSRNNNIDIPLVNSLSQVLIFLNHFNNNLQCNQIIVSDPHQVFFRVIDFFYSTPLTPTIDSNSLIQTKNFGKNVSVGPFTFIDKDVQIGDDVYIANNVTIKGKTLIGNNTIIESGCTIGVDGFGHYKDSFSNQIRVPHLGGVVIGNNVILGSNTTIARGAITNTIISDYVKIDNLCHIAHNVIIGRRSMITACVEISGSVSIGEDVWIGPNSSIINGINIGDKSLIGIGSVVTRNIPENKVAFGVPAKVIRDND